MPANRQVARLQADNDRLREVLDCIGAVCRSGWPDAQKLQTIREAAERHAPGSKRNQGPSHAR